MFHGECEVCGAYFAMIFPFCFCAVLRVLRMRRIRAVSASVENRCATASVKYAFLTFLLFIRVVLVQCCVCRESGGSFLAVSSFLALIQCTCRNFLRVDEGSAIVHSPLYHRIHLSIVRLSRAFCLCGSCCQGHCAGFCTLLRVKLNELPQVFYRLFNTTQVILMVLIVIYPL